LNRTEQTLCNPAIQQAGGTQRNGLFGYQRGEDIADFIKATAGRLLAVNVTEISRFHNNNQRLINAARNASGEGMETWIKRDVFVPVFQDCVVMHAIQQEK
jgi:hypothetical protein